MKKLFVVLLIGGLAAAAVYVMRTGGPGKELEVVCYLRKLDIPQYVPLSGGFFSGSVRNPAFLELRNDRYLIMVVSVPARRLLPLQTNQPPAESSPPETDSPNADETIKKNNRIYPRFLLTCPNDRQYAPKRICAWPPGRFFYRETDFSEEGDWFPPPGDNPNKRYRLGLMWHLVKSESKAPFKLQMDDDPPIEVTSKSFDIHHSWE